MRCNYFQNMRNACLLKIVAKNNAREKHAEKNKWIIVRGNRGSYHLYVEKKEARKKGGQSALQTVVCVG